MNRRHRTSLGPPGPYRLGAKPQALILRPLPQRISLSCSPPCTDGDLIASWSSTCFPSYRQTDGSGAVAVRKNLADSARAVREMGQELEQLLSTPAPTLDPFIPP